MSRNSASPRTRHCPFSSAIVASSRAMLPVRTMARNRFPKDSTQSRDAVIAIKFLTRLRSMAHSACSGLKAVSSDNSFAVRLSFTVSAQRAERLAVCNGHGSQGRLVLATVLAPFPCLAVERLCFVDLLSQAEMFQDPSPSRLTHRPSQFRLSQDSTSRLGEFPRMTRPKSEAGDAVPDHFRRSIHGRSQHGLSRSQ